jgi:hypothetical protein
MNKKRFLLLLLVAVLFSAWKFNDGKSGITSFYYYKGEPFTLTLKTDAVFIKLKNTEEQSSFNQLKSRFPEISNIRNFSVKDKKDFVILNSGLDDAGLLNLVSRLNSAPEVENASVAFSPDNGKTLIGVENEIMVQFKPGTSAEEISSTIKSGNFIILQKISLTGGESYLLQVSKNQFAIDAANDLYKSGKVNWSEPNLFFTNLTCYMPNDPYVTRQWAVRNLGNNIPEGIAGTAGCDMRVDSAWNITLGQPYVKVAINDTGCDTLHVDMAANFIPGTGYNFYSNTPGGFDDYGHGTSCAGIIGAVGNNGIGISGIAPLTKMLPVKWMNSSGSGNYTGATNAIIYCYQKGAWVISNSWGFVGGASSAMDQAINDCTTLGRSGKGCVFAVAAGNENGAMRYPASTHPKVLVVGGVSPCNQRKSTNTCDGETWWGASYGSNMDIVAPCVKIYATDMTNGGFTGTAYDSTFNGTSSATPNTAGVCALILAVDSNLTYDSVRVRIGRTADRVGSYTYNQPGPRNIGLWNNEMGYGKVNAYKVVLQTAQMVGPMISHTPLSNTEQISGNRQVNCVITPANSGINASTAKLYYSKDNTSITNSVVLTKGTGNNWSANLPLTGAGLYRYYLTVTDSLGRTGTSPAGAPANYFSFTASTDTVKPVITHTPVANTPKAQWPATVTASVTDNIGVDSVWVKWYKKPGTTTVKEFRLLLTSGSNFSAAFNSVQNDVNIGDTIYYRVFARDISSMHNTDSTALNHFTIINLVSVIIGTGSTSSSFPFTTYWMDGRTQYLYFNSEFGLGSAQADITAIGFNVISNDAAAMNEFTIKMTNTTLTSISGWQDASGWSTVYSQTYSVPGTGWQMITLTTPFRYTGNNLLVDICYNNSSYTDFSTVYASSTTGDFYGRYGDLNTLSGCGYTSWSNSTAPPGKANTKFIMSPITSVTTTGTIIPVEYSLSQNYPNPFNPVTKINFAIPKQGFVSIKVFDILGREVSKLVSEVKAPGNYSVDFDASALSSGIYFYRLESNGFTDIKRMVLVK